MFQNEVKTQNSPLPKTTQAHGISKVMATMYSDVRFLEHNTTQHN